MDLLLLWCRRGDLLVVILLVDSLGRGLLPRRLRLALCIGGGLLRRGSCSGRGGRRLWRRRRLWRLSFGGLRASEDGTWHGRRTWIFSMSPRRMYLLPADAAAFSSATLRFRSSSSFLSLSMRRGTASGPGARMRSLVASRRTHPSRARPWISGMSRPSYSTAVRARARYWWPR